MAFDFDGMTFSNREEAQEYEATVSPTWMWQIAYNGRTAYPMYGPMTSIVSSSYLRFHSSLKRDAVREARRINRDIYTKVPEFVGRLEKKSKQDWIKEIKAAQKNHWIRNNRLKYLPAEARKKVIKALKFPLKTNPGGNPGHKKSNPTLTAKTLPSTRQGVLLGRLVELELAAGAGSKFIRPRGVYLGYMPKSKDLCLMSKTSVKASRVSPYIRTRHRRFHGVPATKATVFDWPDKEGRLRDVGRIVSLTYEIPKGLKSPEKGRYRWRHAFGDHGEAGHGRVKGRKRYPVRFQPMLQVDEEGHLFIKRMPGNKFYVTDWLYW